MNKPTAILLVLAFSLPAVAGTVAITITDNWDGTADIRYTADANVRAFALDITVDAGTIYDITYYFIGECDDVNKGYGVFPGTINILETGEVNDWGSPVAEVADLPSDTKPGLGNNGITIEMGALYTPGRRPSRTGTLCRLTVSAPCNMTVTGNAGRGMVILEDGTQATLNLAGATNVWIDLPCCAPFPDLIGMTEANALAVLVATGYTSAPTVDHVPDNDNVGLVVAQSPTAGFIYPMDVSISLNVGYAYPACWDLPRQCHADYSNDGLVDTADWAQLRDGWLKVYPNPAYLANACGDYNRDGIIDTADWPQIRDWWLKSPPGDCVNIPPLPYDPD